MNNNNTGEISPLITCLLNKQNKIKQKFTDWIVYSVLIINRLTQYLSPLTEVRIDEVRIDDMTR